MKIAITTPTGTVGSRLVRLVLQAGERPTLLVRDGSKLAPEVREACDLVEVDQGDADAVVAATAGADALYWVDPPTDDDDPIAGHARMARSAAAAVRENRIGRVVFQSSVGAEARHGFGEIDGLGATEELLDSTGASVVHLRCGYFFSNLLMDAETIAQGELTTTLPLDQRIPWVAPEDIATAAALRLVSTAWSGRITQAVHGPADLSFTEVAEIVGDAVGEPVVARRVTDDDVSAQLRTFGMTDKQIEGIVGMARGLRSPHTAEDQRTIATTTATTLRSWACEHLRPRVQELRASTG